MKAYAIDGAWRPLTRGECEPCATCQAFADGDLVVADASGALPCGHRVAEHANHCRPCPWVSCRHHLLIEIARGKPQVNGVGKKRDARPTSIRLNRENPDGQLGRRPGLCGPEPAEIVRAWIRDAVEHLEHMPQTCTLDVADANPDGLRLTEIADRLGVTSESIREDDHLFGARLREGMRDYEDHVPADLEGNLSRATSRSSRSR